MLLKTVASPGGGGGGGGESLVLLESESHRLKKMNEYPRKTVFSDLHKTPH